MSIRFESIAFRNSSLSLNRAPASMALCRAPPASLGFQTLCKPKTLSKVSMSSIPTIRGLNLRQRTARKRFVSSFAAASHDESKASDIDVDKEKEDLKTGAQDSQEALQQALESFKQQALKMKSISKEAYELNSEKAIVIYKKTSEIWKIQAEKAIVILKKTFENLNIQAEKVLQDLKVYQYEYAENSPESVKDIFQTFVSLPYEMQELSDLRDFHIGITYGIFLFVGGLLWFVVTGSIPALRFGVILGGCLLALSVSSMRLWKMRMFSPAQLKEQMVIATILFLREARLLFVRSFLAHKTSTLISGGVVALYIYVFIRDGGLRGFNPKAGQEN